MTEPVSTLKPWRRGAIQSAELTSLSQVIRDNRSHARDRRRCLASVTKRAAHVVEHHVSANDIGLLVVLPAQVGGDPFRGPVGHVPGREVRPLSAAHITPVYIAHVVHGCDLGLPRRRNRRAARCRSRCWPPFGAAPNTATARVMPLLSVLAARATSRPCRHRRSRGSRSTTRGTRRQAQSLPSPSSR
jgi:hypothetical protein